MIKKIKLLVYPVSDIVKAKAFCNKFIEAEFYVDSPYYVGYKIGDLEVGFDPNSTASSIVYIDVADIKAS